MRDAASVARESSAARARVALDARAAREADARRMRDARAATNAATRAAARVDARRRAALLRTRAPRRASRVRRRSPTPARERRESRATSSSRAPTSVDAKPTSLVGARPPPRRRRRPRVVDATTASSRERASEISRPCARPASSSPSRSTVAVAVSPAASTVLRVAATSRRTPRTSVSGRRVDAMCRSRRPSASAPSRERSETRRASSGRPRRRTSAVVSNLDMLAARVAARSFARVAVPTLSNSNVHDESVCELSRVSLDRPSDARSSRASRHVDARDAMRDDDDDDAFGDVDAHDRGAGRRRSLEANDGRWIRGAI